MRRAVAVAIALASVLAVAATVASAHHSRVRDRDDVKGPLDMRVVTAEGRTYQRYRIDTYWRWSATSIWDKGYLMVFLDTIGSDHPDYYALVRSNGSNLEAILFRDRRDRPDYRLTRLRVWRATQRSVTVRVPQSWLNFSQTRLYYKWYVLTLMTRPGCARVCFDRVPNSGVVLEPNPQLAPPPSPSPTPTLTPSIP